MVAKVNLVNLSLRSGLKNYQEMCPGSSALGVAGCVGLWGVPEVSVEFIA